MVDSNNKEKGESHLNEAINIFETYEKLGRYNHRLTFLRLLINAAYFYTHHHKDKGKAIYLANRAISIMLLSDMVDYIKAYATKTLRSIFREFNEPFPVL